MKEQQENKLLKEIICKQIRKKGRITFAQYMDMALYHPVHGYYNSQKEKIGTAGDYYTSPHIHSVFGSLIAELLYDMWQALGRRADFKVVEAGSGKGFLCCDILDYTKKQWPDFYNALTYLLIERSSHFSASQRALLKSHSHQKKTIWFSPEELQQGNILFTGCYLSNELLDSFPFNRVQMSDGRLKEIYVTADENGFKEELGDLSTKALERYFAHIHITLEEGQKAEVNLEVLDWLREINTMMEQGFILTIDYGYDAEELFAPYRKDGTLACYYKHSVHHDPYIRLGLQDITAHVDFTTLMQWGDTLGLKRTLYLEQYRFLTALGLLKRMEEIEKNKGEMSTLEYYKEKLSMKNFLIPGSLGVTFKVCMQRKGIEDLSLDLFKEELLE